jgi:hypothetical protein
LRGWCKIYWKEAWLRRVDDASGVIDAPDGQAADLERVAQAGTRVVGEADDAPELWRCQATEAFRASESLKTSNLSGYWREFSNGNFGPLRFILLAARGLVMEVADRVGLLKPLPLRGPGSPSSPTEPLNLQPGDLARVRSPAEIAATLDDGGFNRGLSFNREMLPFCGRTFRVKERVQQIVDDKTGRMLKIPKDSLGASAAQRLSTPCRRSETRRRPAPTTSLTQKRRRARLQQRSCSSVRSAEIARANSSRYRRRGDVRICSPRTGSRRRLNAARSTPTGDSRVRLASRLST